MPFQSYIYIGELKIPMSGYYFGVMRIICSTAIIPVSYTHLDVYKRQSGCRHLMWKTRPCFHKRPSTVRETSRLCITLPRRNRQARRSAPP